MPEVHQAPSGGKGGDPLAAHDALRRLVDAAHAVRDAWSRALEGSTYPRVLPSFTGLVRELDAWLADVEAAAARGAAPAPTTGVGAGVRPLDLGDRDAVRAWLADLRTQIADVAAAGEDATRAPARRMLGRPMARSAIVEGRCSLEQLLAAAERGLT